MFSMFCKTSVEWEIQRLRTGQPWILFLFNCYNWSPNNNLGHTFPHGCFCLHIRFPVTDLVLMTPKWDPHIWVVHVAEQAAMNIYYHPQPSNVFIFMVREGWCWCSPEQKTLSKLSYAEEDILRKCESQRRCSTKIWSRPNHKPNTTGNLWAPQKYITGCWDIANHLPNSEMLYKTLYSQQYLQPCYVY